MVANKLIAPSHRSIRKFYEQSAALREQHVFSEMNVRSPFEFLLADTAKLQGWTLIPELSAKAAGGVIRPDGTLRDRNSLPRGCWEAKDTQDDLPTEIKKQRPDTLLSRSCAAPHSEFAMIECDMHELLAKNSGGA